MTILVTYGSKRGGTRGLAETMAQGLREEGFEVDLVPAGQAEGVGSYEAVVIGGALYAARWHRDARRFVKRHAAELRGRPTYFFSSGPLDESATDHEIPPVRGVKVLMDRVGAERHATFGGRLDPQAKGFVASAMAKKSSGDWRDRDQVRSWARDVAIDVQVGIGRGE